MIIIKRILVCLIMVVDLCFVPAAAKSDIIIYLTDDGGNTLCDVSFSDVQPAIINNRVLIPARGLFENLGCAVTWEQSTSTVIVKNQTKTIKIPVGFPYIFVNGSRINTDVPAQVINSRTMIPVRVVSEALELKVEWVSKKNAVIIHRNADEVSGGSLHKNLGTAGFIGDKTIIVSIFASDSDTSWDFSKAEDNAIAAETLRYLGTATKWISDNLKTYNTNSEFIYDWGKNKDLVYAVRFHHKLVTSGGEYYEYQADYIKKFINSDELLKKYGAENIIYMFFINTPFSNEHNPWSINKNATNNVELEIINVFHRFDNKIVSKSPVYAHEIMHCFGAKDLYYENAYIPQSYVDYCKKIKSKDIMYTVNQSEKIIEEFSELDAYYMGIINYCEEAEKWNLGQSDFANLTE